MELLIECLIFTTLFVEKHINIKVTQLHKKEYFTNVKYSKKKLKNSTIRWPHFPFRKWRLHFLFRKWHRHFLKAKWSHIIMKIFIFLNPRTCIRSYAARLYEML